MTANYSLIIYSSRCKVTGPTSGVNVSIQSNPPKGTNTYLVGTGPQRLLIDTGEGKPSWPRLLSSVLSSETASVSHALITHWHPDHIGGIKDLLALCPNAIIHKHNPTAGQLDINDSQKIQADGATLRAFHCPGHTTDHVALILEEEDAMFTGDNVLGHGTAVFEDLAVYLDSLKRMRNQFSGRAYPGHGPVIPDGRTRIAEYIEHRHQREEEVLKVLKDIQAQPGNNREVSRFSVPIGTCTPRQLVKVIYKDVPESLHGPAERGVLQVLKKLAGEGKVEQSGEGWFLAEKAAL